MSEFVEAAVRSAVEFRRVQIRFHERGEIAWQNYQRSAAAILAAQVFGELQAKLDAKRKHLGRVHKP